MKATPPITAIALATSILSPQCTTILAFSPPSSSICRSVPALHSVAPRPRPARSSGPAHGTTGSSRRRNNNLSLNLAQFPANLAEKEKKSEIKSVQNGHDDNDDNTIISDIDSIEIETNNAISKKNDSTKERTLGILVLLTVPLAWGTYTPVVKYMYDVMNPSMPGFVFSAGYYVVASLSLRVLNWMSAKDDIGDASSIGYVGSKNVTEIMMTTSDDDEKDIVTRGGWELGSYLFIGNGLQVVGLQTVPADRAAFLVQLTTVLVPLLSAISAGNLSAVPLPTWIACIIAFVGVIVMGADGNDGSKAGDAIENFDATNSAAVGTANVGEDVVSTIVGTDNIISNNLLGDFHFDPSSLQLSQGDMLIVLAAVSYTMHVVRLGAYAPRTTALRLAASKATTEAILSIALVVALVVIGSIETMSMFPEFVGKMGTEVVDYFQVIGSSATAALGESGDNVAAGRGGQENSLAASVAAILWTGWVTCAYTIYAQSFGQRRVSPTDSNLIYTTQPLFSSLFAYFLLGETLGFYGYVGATLIATALWMVSSSDGRSSDVESN